MGRRVKNAGPRRMSLTGAEAIVGKAVGDVKCPELVDSAMGVGLIAPNLLVVTRKKSTQKGKPSQKLDTFDVALQLLVVDAQQKKRGRHYSHACDNKALNMTELRKRIRTCILRSHKRRAISDLVNLRT